MPSTRAQIPPSRNVGLDFQFDMTLKPYSSHQFQATYSRMHARLYSVSSTHPAFISILTRKEQHGHFPIVEEAMSGMRTQPHIHDVVVTVRRGRRLYHFNIFLKNHCRLPLNPTISSLVPWLRWNGDILVKRVGVVVPGVVNMRRSDPRLADFAVRR